MVKKTPNIQCPNNNKHTVEISNVDNITWYTCKECKIKGISDSQVTKKKKNKDTGGCIGLCCSSFILYDDTIENYTKEASHDKESAFIVDMLIPIGLDEDFNPVYTCRHWDKKSKLCTVYEQRPSMCRTYPDGEACTWQGCTVKG